jgi:hypothetical protein
MVGEAIAGLSAFSSMLNIVKTMKDMNDLAVRNAAISGLREKIFAAQTRYAAAVERVHQLENQIAKIQRWETDSKRYELTEIVPGVRAYRLKESMRDNEPAHEACVTCYAERHIGILQHQTWSPGRCHVLVCNDCGSVIYVSGSPSPEHESYRPTPLSP